MSLPLIAAGAQALSGILGGVIGGRRRRREQRAAQAEFNRARSRFEALDTSNPYANITNTATTAKELYSVGSEVSLSS